MKKIKLGVTGGIGSGKTLICKIFRVLGAPVYNADSRARWLMNNDEKLKKEIIDAFGEDSYTPNGLLKRDYLAEKVFHNEPELKILNSLVHPAAGIDYEKWQTQQNKPYSIKEAALMFESGSDQSLDFVITVSAPEEIRIERILKRDPFRNESEVRAIISKQLTEKERIERADFVIINDDDHMVIPQVLDLNEKINQDYL